MAATRSDLADWRARFRVHRGFVGPHAGCADFPASSAREHRGPSRLLKTGSVAFLSVAVVRVVVRRAPSGVPALDLGDVVADHLGRAWHPSIRVYGHTCARHWRLRL